MNKTSYPEDDLWREDFLEEDGSQFHIGQYGGTEPAMRLRCKKCGGIEFQLARAEYFTAAKCSKCQWEVCVHEG